MRSAFSTTLVLCLVVASARGDFGEPAGEELFLLNQANITLSLSPPAEPSRPGQTVWLPARVMVPTGFWLYSPTPRGQYATVQPLRAQVTADDPLSTGEPRYPRPMWHSTEITASMVEHNLAYEQEMIFFIPIEVPAGTADGEYTVSTVITGQTCDEMGCYPADAQARAVLRVAENARGGVQASKPPQELELRTTDEWDALLPQTPDGSLPREVEEGARPGTTAGDVPRPGVGMTATGAMALAFLAGIALNVMPCVLPVIPLKIMSILEQARQSRRRSVLLGLTYAGGIVLFFAAVAAASVALRMTTGTLLSLDEPFQYPAFIIGMMLLMVVLALGLFNVYAFGVGGQLAGSGPRGGYLGSVWTGVLTALLGTPCSGPVVASVFGWAQGQSSPWAGGWALLAMGLGMALPHAVLASFPGLLEKLPRPGMWMERLKQFMGFILLVVAAWLLSVLGDATWMGWVAAYAVVLSLCVWMAGGWVTPSTSTARRWTIRLVAFALAVSAGAWMLPEPEPPIVDWRPYDPAEVAALRDDGQTLLVKYTAEWCLKCKEVDMVVFGDEATAAALREREAPAFLADVTRKGSPASRSLYGDLGEAGPPVTTVYGPAIEGPIRLHGVYSREDLISALDRAAGRTDDVVAQRTGGQ